MQAREYARSAETEHMGYVECLQNIRHDHADGVSIDFTGWEDAEALTGLNDDDLDLLVTMYKDFYESRKERILTIIRHGGVTPGAPQTKKSENFAEEAEKYIDGKETGSDAARNCGLQYTTFRNRIDSLIRNKACVQNDEIWKSIQDVCLQWKRHEINKTEAAKRLGIRVPTFNKILTVQGIERDTEPVAFGDAYESWKKGRISKADALQRCGICRSYFEELVRMRQKKELQELTLPS